MDAGLDYNPLWMHSAHCAFPSATQNELNDRDAATLASNGVVAVAEGEHAVHDRGRQDPHRCRRCMRPARRPTPGRRDLGLEMAQNSACASWPREQVDRRAPPHHEIDPPRVSRDVRGIRRSGNYAYGANIAGFLKVANAMLDQGLV